MTTVLVVSGESTFRGSIPATPIWAAVRAVVEGPDNLPAAAIDPPRVQRWRPKGRRGSSRPRPPRLRGWDATCLGRWVQTHDHHPGIAISGAEEALRGVALEQVSPLLQVGTVQNQGVDSHTERHHAEEALGRKVLIHVHLVHTVPGGKVARVAVVQRPMVVDLGEHPPRLHLVVG